MKIVILNGPPGSGKDTIAKLLMEQLDCEVHTMKAPMFKIAMASVCCSEEEFMQRYEDRSLKEEPWDVAGGRSIRELMIEVSENWVKPSLGKKQFGLLAAHRASQAKTGMVIFSDGGFVEETEAIMETFGSNNVLCIQLHREGYNFDNDSRGYLEMSDLWTAEVRLIEHQEMKGALDCLARINHMKW